MELIFPDNIKDDLMFINTVYHRPTYNDDYNDMLEIVYRDLTTGEKDVISIENPKMDIYVAKPQFRNSYYREFMPLDEVDKISVPYKNLEMEIAKMAGENYVKMVLDNNKNKNRYANKNIHKWENVYGSDYDIEQWLRIHWMLNHDNDKIKKPTKGYTDIEVDTITLNRFPEPGEVPVNAVTLVDAEDKKVYTLLLRNPENPLIEEFEKDIDNFVKELHETFDETYGELDYQIYMYDLHDELELLRDMFRLINQLKLDFILIWNMDFDIPYLIERIKVLGADPAEVMSHRDFKRKCAYYNKPYDAGVVVNRSSRFVVSSYTSFQCQMTIYAGMRKGQGELPSLNLNSVGQKEIGDEKLNYSEEANISTLPYVNYKKFVMYNIKDVLLQMGIENKAGDVDNLYRRSYTNCISYEKTFKQTKFEEDRAYVEYYKQGLIIGNNINLEYGVDKSFDDNDDSDESFDGGLVADPGLFSNVGMPIFGIPSRHAMRNVVDFDFSSMYPWMIITFNLSRNTMIGKLIIDAQGNSVLKFAEDLEGEADKGKIFLENYLTDHPLMLGKKWFNLPSVEEMVLDIAREFNVNVNAKMDIYRTEIGSHDGELIKIA